MKIVMTDKQAIKLAILSRRTDEGIDLETWTNDGLGLGDDWITGEYCGMTMGIGPEGDSHT
ncbi:hypothetical protein LCGC14_0220420 [marine sediment metagenome]|uniref:Uncharacterized protein n=1 Tax=marine sediment metagenome TaxID=412755 RepID=A0A0F9WXL7_9ZZZZ